MDNLQKYDPNSPGIPNGNIFGLPFNKDNAQTVILPVPWDVTVSYNDGTANAPRAILEASLQVDLFDPNAKDEWKKGIHMLPISTEWKAESDKQRIKSKVHIAALENEENIADNSVLNNSLREINESCKKLNEWVENQTSSLIDNEKLVGILGGDHSTPLGFIQALSKKHDSFSILQIDAHCDLRKSYEGFQFSHASIMNNALKFDSIDRLVQIGIRDYCDEESNYILGSNDKVKMFTSRNIQEYIFKGGNWDSYCERVISHLSDSVYLSFDIDGLDPKLCPNTGTPVPGGITYSQALYLIQKVLSSGRKIIGFDLCEVGNRDWDANVGARILFFIATHISKYR